MGLSGGGLYPNVSYQATKGAIVNMTRALAVEWAPHGVRVNAVAPTYVRTDLIEPILKDPALVARIELPLSTLARGLVTTSRIGGGKSGSSIPRQAVVAARHVRNSSSRRMRSVLRDTRWR